MVDVTHTISTVTWDVNGLSTSWNGTDNAWLFSSQECLKWPWKCVGISGDSVAMETNVLALQDGYQWTRWKEMNCLRLIGGTGSVLSRSSSPDSALCSLGQSRARVCFDSKSHLELGTEHGARRLCIFPPACLATSCPSLSKLFLFSLSTSFVPSWKP